MLISKLTKMQETMMKMSLEPRGPSPILQL